jgi:hypothetical protein
MKDDKNCVEINDCKHYKIRDGRDFTPFGADFVPSEIQHPLGAVFKPIRSAVNGLLVVIQPNGDMWMFSKKEWENPYNPFHKVDYEKLPLSVGIRLRLQRIRAAIL